MDQRTRKLITIHKVLLPRYSVDRLYVPRKGRGRRFASIEDCVAALIYGHGDYIEKNKDRLITPANNIIVNIRTNRKTTKTWKEK